jgi:flagellar biosynthesis protein FliQ
MGKVIKNQTLVYVIAIAVIVIAFILLGGGHWMNGRMNQSHMSHWNWTQIIISMVIGFAIGLLAAKRKWL